MSKKQTNSFNFISLFFILSFCCLTKVFSQATEQNLAMADSLFEQKKYTESFNIYEQILSVEKKATSRMFLRMAFIKEGLGNYTEALYYLNKYFLSTSDKSAQNKMKEIAEENDLIGFNINDRTFFQRQLRAYSYGIKLILFTISIGIFIIILYRKLKLRKNSLSMGFALLIFLSTLFYLLNYGSSIDEGIIIKNHAYIMSGPSAGSDLIEVVKNGHKVKIVEESGLWVEIEWQGKKGFIRKGKIKKLG